ncbi:MAG: AbrB/MazE/SpoVT family DNA-binding domain-containing protein [Thermoleophilia bacterium]|jgi:bifunctional DNA-binding transcriptional regulator/antitoxin component of YhaV-PrlF toxin-antitoxin module|nr:AbrB/MazE/SpoVT family DNA-binding domain-containing protein [Thermoleophilia bacterium]
MGEEVRKRVRGTTRISAKHQVTIPVEALRQAGLEPGDVLRVEADGERIVMRRVENPFLRFAGTLTGVYPPGYLDALRDEWR